MPASDARQRRRVDLGVGRGVQIYLEDALARKVVNTLFQFGPNDALETTREAQRNPFHPLLVEAGVLDMDPEDVIHPARLFALDLRRPWTRSRMARARGFVQKMIDADPDEVLSFLSDKALLKLLKYAANQVHDATHGDRISGVTPLYRGVWVDNFKQQSRYTLPFPTSFTPNFGVAEGVGGADVQAKTEPVFVWELNMGIVTPSLVTDTEVILPAGTVLSSRGCPRSDIICPVSVVDVETMPVEYPE